MKAAAISGYDAPVLITEINKPVLKNDSVLIKVSAASLNPIDNILRSGAMKRDRSHTTAEHSAICKAR